jgi:hypothetical protein
MIQTIHLPGKNDYRMNGSEKKEEVLTGLQFYSENALLFGRKPLSKKHRVSPFLLRNLFTG